MRQAGNDAQGFREMLGRVRRGKMPVFAFKIKNILCNAYLFVKVKLARLTWTS